MRKTLATVVLLIALPGVLLGAETTGRIIGRVLDEAGQPVFEARVSLVSSALQGERVTATDAEGRFLQALLPVGPYAVSVAAPGRKTATVSLRVKVGGTEPLQFRLEPGEQVTETVVVHGTLTPLETTAVGENFNYRTAVEEWPIISRDAEDIAKLAPGVTNFFPGSDPGPGRYISISGGTRFENVTLLDGAELTDQLGFVTRRLYLEDSIEEMQVLTAGVSARYGRFSGGVLNVITKGGGNTFDGTVRAEFSKETWNERTPLGETQSDTLNKVYQATLGGYILQDKLWFFAGGRTIPALTTSGRTFLTNEDWIQEETEDRLQIKLRGGPAANHTIEASYLDSELNIDGGNGGQGIIPGDLRTASSRGRFPGDLTTLTYQAVLGSATFVEAMASKRNVRSARGGALALGSPIWDAAGGDNLIYNNAPSEPNDPVDRDNQTASVNVTHLLGTQSRGTHTLETGVQYVETITGGASAFAATGFLWANFFNGAAFPFVEPGAAPGEVLFNVNSADQFNLRAEDLPLDGEQHLENLAVYVHDSWQQGKWRVDAGVRWEHYEGSAPTGLDLGIDADELAPRLGLTYNVRPNLQLQGFWGRYVARLEDVFLSRNTGLGFSPSIVRVYVGPEVLGATAADLEVLLLDDSNWGPLFQLTDPANPTSFLAVDLDVPYAADLNLSLRYGLPRSSGSITFSYIDREFDNLLEPQVGEFGTVDVPAPDGPEILTVDRILLDNTPLAKRSYQAFAMTWDYRPGARWDVGGNWTYGETRGNQEEDLTNIGSALGTYERSRPEAAAVPTGPLFWDKTHLINAWGNYRFDLKKAGTLTLGGIARYESGSPWSRQANVPYSADPLGVYVNETANVYSHYFDGRGNNNFDDWWSLDLSGRYQFPIGGKLNGWVKATVSNVFDNDALIAFNTSGSATTTPPAICPGCVTDTINGLTWVPGPDFGMARSVFDYQRPRGYLFTLGLAF